MPELLVDLTRLPGLRALPDFRSIFVPESRAAWAGKAIYHAIAPAPAGRFTAGFTGGVDSPVFLFFLWPWTVMPDIVGRLSRQLVEIFSLALAVALAYRGLGSPRWAEAILVAVLVLFSSRFATRSRKAS